MEGRGFSRLLLQQQVVMLEHYNNANSKTDEIVLFQVRQELE